MDSNPIQKRSRVGFLAVLSCFPDGTPWPINPHKYPIRKVGRPSKEVLEQRKIHNEWHHEHITIPHKEMENKFKGKIMYKSRGNGTI